jgi:hypothetical protein
MSIQLCTSGQVLLETISCHVGDQSRQGYKATTSSGIYIFINNVLIVSKKNVPNLKFKMYYTNIDGTDEDDASA